MQRTIGFTEEHDLFRDSFRTFMDKEAVPNRERWESDGVVDRALFTEAGKNGFLGIDAAEAHGGGGTPDFRYNQIMVEEIERAAIGGSGLALSLHNDICMPYFTTLANEEQQARWLPGICSGEQITAVAMTEPGCGSDLASIKTTATRDGDHFVVNGSKTFITNGINADLVITAVKTDPKAKHAGVSLLILERGMDGFERGRNLDKIGLHSQDTAELFFNDVRVPAENLLGQEGQGFRSLMVNLPRERLSIGIAGVAAAQASLDRALAYTAEREAFGSPLNSLQTMKFRLAELATEVRVGQAFIDQCVLALNAGELTAEEAAMAKWWCPELQGRAVDSVVQMHGGYGYMTEYAAGRAYVDARITRIYGGTTEIMKEIIGRDLVKRADAAR